MSAHKSPFALLARTLMACVVVLTLVPMPAQAEEADDSMLFEPLPESVMPEEPASLDTEEAISSANAEEIVLDEAATDGTDGADGPAATDAELADDPLVLEEQNATDESEIQDDGQVSEEGIEVEQSADDAILVVQDDESEEKAASSLSVQDDSVTKPLRVGYRSHMAGGAWSSYVYDGEVSGSIGSAACIDAMSLKLDKGDTGLDGGITYRMHSASKGWLKWVQDGARGGAAKGLRVEALQVKLTGAVAARYNVYYSVYLQGRGWMSWAMDGATTGSVGMGLRIEGIRIVLVKRGDKAPSSSHVTYKGVLVSGNPVSVQPNVQGQGWLPAVGNNIVAGTTGQKLRLQALKVSLPSAEVPGTVKVKGHIQGAGWTQWAKSTVDAGASKRLEAIALKLSGEAAAKYDIYYRAHVSRLGWMAWAMNGKPAGTKGLSIPIEAVQVYVVKKSEPAPSNSGSIGAAYYTGTNVRYSAHCQSYGWRKEVKNGATAGTTGKSKRLEAFTARLSGGTITGGINYSSFVAGSGWQNDVSNNAVSGTMGQSRAVQAIRVSLSGHAAAVYDVWYRVHISTAGWLGWARNYEVAGAPNTGKDVQAIEIVLRAKNSAAPGSTANHYIDASYFNPDMTMRAQRYSSPTPWLILVDVDETRLAVFRGSMGNWKLYDNWMVSCGAPGSSTVRGVFSVGDRGYVFGHGYSCYYYTQFYGAYLFHSVKYYEGTFNIMDGRLGEHISLGCVRMDINNAKWIYDTIPSGTTVVTY